MAILSKRNIVTSIVILTFMTLVSKVSYQVGRADGIREMKLRMKMEPGKVIEMLQRSKTGDQERN